MRIFFYFSFPIFSGVKQWLFLLCFFFDWFSVFVDAMSTLPVQDEVGCSTDSQRCVILIFFLVTALNAVIVSRFGLDINDLKSFVLLPNVWGFFPVFLGSKACGPAENPAIKCELTSRRLIFFLFFVFLRCGRFNVLRDEGGAWPCGLLLYLLRGPLRLGSLGGLRDSTLCTSSDGGGSEEVRSWGSWWGWIGYIESDKW